jgi:hypothetical protein
MAENFTAEEIKLNQIRELYAMLYPLIVKDFLSLIDATKMHQSINALSQSQVAAFESLKAIFQTHTHTYLTPAGAPAPTTPPLTVSGLSMRPFTILPDNNLAEKLVMPPSGRSLIPRKTGPNIVIPPFSIEK